MSTEGLSRFDTHGLPVGTARQSPSPPRSTTLPLSLDDAGIERAVIYGSSYGTPISHRSSASATWPRRRNGARFLDPHRPRRSGADARHIRSSALLVDGSDETATAIPGPSPNQGVSPVSLTTRSPRCTKWRPTGVAAFGRRACRGRGKLLSSDRRAWRLRGRRTNPMIMEPDLALISWRRTRLRPRSRRSAARPRRAVRRAFRTKSSSASRCRCRRNYRTSMADRGHHLRPRPDHTTAHRRRIAACTIPGRRARPL